MICFDFPLCAFLNRCWAEKAPFLSSFCRSLEATGLKEPIMSWVTQWMQSSCSPHPQTHAPSWNLTQQLRSSGNTSWARLDTLSTAERDHFCHHLHLFILYIKYFLLSCGKVKQEYIENYIYDSKLKDDLLIKQNNTKQKDNIGKTQNMKRPDSWH